MVEGLASFRDAPPRGLIVDASRSAMLAKRPTPDIFRAVEGLGVLGQPFPRRMGIAAPSTLPFVPCLCRVQAFLRLPLNAHRRESCVLPLSCSCSARSVWPPRRLEGWAERRVRMSRTR